MSSALLDVGRLGSWYVVGSLLAMLGGLALLPMLTNSAALSLPAYGRWGLIEGGVGVAHTLLGLQLGAALIRFYADAQTRAAATATAWWLSVTLVVALGGLAFATLAGGARSTLGPVAFSAVALWQAELLTRVPLALLRARETAGRFAAVTAFKHVALIALVWLFVARQRGGLGGLVNAFALAGAATLVLALLAAGVGPLFARPDATLVRRMLRYSLPIVAEEGSAVLLHTADRYIVAWFSQPAAVAPYMLAVKLGGMLRRGAVAPIRRALWPVLFRVDDAARPQLLAAVAAVVCAVLSLGALAAVVCARPLVDVIGADPRYLAALPMLPYITFAAVASGVMEVFHGVLALRHHTGLSSLWFAGATTASLVLDVVLVPRLGPFGAAVSAFAAALLLLAGQARSALRLLPASLPWATLGLVFGVSFALALSGAALAGPAHAPGAMPVVHVAHLAASAAWAVCVLRWVLWPRLRTRIDR